MIMDRLERFRCYQRSVPELWDAVRFAERVQKEQTSYRKVVVKIKIDKLLHGVPAMERTATMAKEIEDGNKD